MHHVIIGGGPAGVIAAETIRKQAPYDNITIVSDEAVTRLLAYGDSVFIDGQCEGRWHLSA